MARGKVRWFNDRKGFGFIRVRDTSEELFVHHSSIMEPGFRTLMEGDEVQFEIEEGPKGRRAVNVMRV